MANTPILQIVAGATSEDRATTEKFYKWLEDVHVPEMFQYKGFKRILNCRRVTGYEPFQPKVVDYPEYISVTEFYSRQDMEDFPKAAGTIDMFKDGLETWGTEIGRKKIWLVTYEQTKTLERQLEIKGNIYIQIVSGVAPKDPETAQRFYKWIEEAHLPHNFNEFKGLAKATNYKRLDGVEVPFKPMVTEYPYYITMWEFNSLADFKFQMDSIKGRPPASDEWGVEYGYTKSWLVSYEVIKSWER
jgi:hypothetical protein